jgi:hypothetical protein
MLNQPAVNIVSTPDVATALRRRSNWALTFVLGQLFRLASGQTSFSLLDKANQPPKAWKAFSVERQSTTNIQGASMLRQACSVPYRD